MIEWVLDTHYAEHFNCVMVCERSLLVFETPESALVPLMETVERQFPGIKAFSLPSLGDGKDGRPARRHIELGVKGELALVEPAFTLIELELRVLGAVCGPCER
jgi:molybdopterin-biosynthesis enzyme MoeA-like protein